MVEIEHRVDSRKVRIPLAGPANRQGRIAAENALGGKHPYKGSIGTSIVRVFDAVAGITGLSLKQARTLGLNADAVVVHKEHHTTYYPGAETVSVMLVFDKETGVILGGQTAGYKGADRRLDVIATAVANKLTVGDMADVDFAYSPPLGTANDAINMAAYTAENRISGYSPSVTAAELDNYLESKEAIFIDVRDMFAYNNSHVEDAENIPLELLSQSLKSIPREYTIVVYDETGKKGHQALRMLKGAGFENIVNLSGGHISLQRHARAVGFKNIQLELLPIEQKSLDKNIPESKEEKVETVTEATTATDFNSPIVVDVRSREEFSYGAYPNAICLPLDELSYGYENALGANLDRDITLYCASGARSAYAAQYLRQLGYTNVKNGGGLMQMMRKYRF